MGKKETIPELLKWRSRIIKSKILNLLITFILIKVNL